MNNPMMATKKGTKATGRAGPQPPPPQTVLMSNGNPNAILDAIGNGRFCDRRNSLPAHYLHEILRHPELYQLFEQSRRLSLVNQPTGSSGDTTNGWHTKCFSTQHLNYAGAEQTTHSGQASETMYGDSRHRDLHRRSLSTQQLAHEQARRSDYLNQGAGFVARGTVNGDRHKNFPSSQRLKNVRLQDVPPPLPLKFYQPAGSPGDTTNGRHPKCFSTQHLNDVGAKQDAYPGQVTEAMYRDSRNGNLHKKYFSTQHLDQGRARQGGYLNQAAGFVPRDTMNGVGARHKNFHSTQHLDQIGLNVPPPSPWKRARLHLKFSNLPRKFTLKDVIQKILGTDKMLVVWDEKPDISLKVERDGSLSCIAQFINEKEADMIRMMWNGTEIVKGKGKLVVEYLESS